MVFMTVSQFYLPETCSIRSRFAYMMGNSWPRFNDEHQQKQPNDMTERISGEPAVPPESDAPRQKSLSPAALRALAEAEARRQAYRKQEAALPKEYGGRGGKEPVRYGDWEVKGLAADF
jgi:hypothetical protein